MVGTRADNSDSNSVFLVPAGIAIDDVNAVSGVQVINGTFAVDSPDLCADISDALIGGSREKHGEHVMEGQHGKVRMR